MAARFTFFAPRAAIGAALIGAMTLSASPAAAQDYDRNRDGIGAGEIIAGAVVLGGLAAILSSTSNNRNDRNYRGGGNDRNGYDYRRYGDGRSAVNQCVRSVERDGRRFGRARVDQVSSIDRKRDGYRIKGRVVAENRNDRNWNNRGRYQNGRFTCDVRYGRVQDVKISGLRR